MELFDVIDSKGNPAGQIVSREKAHAEGIPHRTAHIWIIRKKEGRVQILLQKRSQNKDSFPGKFDTSSAGHSCTLPEPSPYLSQKNFMEKCFGMKKLLLSTSIRSL